FQAEDGIRDKLVTGVQTCALPIYQTGAPVGQVGLLVVTAERKAVIAVRLPVRDETADVSCLGQQRRADVEAASGPAAGLQTVGRSEERRVGKECRTGR